MYEWKQPHNSKVTIAAMEVPYIHIPILLYCHCNTQCATLQLITSARMRSEGVSCLCVCLCVCVCLWVSALILALRATRRSKSGNNEFSATLARFIVNLLRSKVMAWNTSEKANMLMSTASPRPVFTALYTVEASEVTQRSSRASKSAFKRYLRIQSAWSWTIRMCLHRNRMRV